MPASHKDLEQVLCRIAILEKEIAGLKDEVCRLKEPGASSQAAGCEAIQSSPARVPGVGEYERLYSEFLAVGPQVVQRFVDSYTEEVLAAFCLTNEVLAAPTRLSKSQAAVRIARAFAARRGKAKRG